ncbi:low specificity L-threonine aldolase [Longibacter salinarum]|uniref:Low specificity L-threonine aldolase n=1 Tax=Longibacter salinarum TaxID=1850348 RepID=A0A2A8D230_9BACT|nr:GntG family PLP-dependent aldolase [Longibacter salinarum]PEN14985.1 low specificity L-threonine aldolase [Longibacter salinarum]
MIDLRSDTVTRPTPAMREAMANAEVGDDVYGEDPTINRLQDRCAELFGVDATLFVPSGTMANQICLHVLTDPGDEVILDRSSHVFNYESGASGMISGVQLNPIDTSDGRLSTDDVEAAIRPDMPVYARSRVVSIENTANKAGGVVYDLNRIHDIAAVVRAHRLRFHLDGARLWNASVALDVPVHSLVKPFDIAWAAFSKGIGAPVGSIIAGSQDLINAARTVRKQLGGGMRQSGVLAAAALVGLDGYRERLARDHANARRIADTVSDLDAFDLDLERVQTNIIIFDVHDGTAESVIEKLARHDVHVTPFGPQTVRITLHRDISDADVNATMDALKAEFA